MQKLSVLFSLFLAIIIISCSNDPVGSDDLKDSGKILLKIDKQNAPESIVFVKAYLTRENHQPITGLLNLQSDSTADILMESIDAGEWHLKVDAEDDSGLVLYTGETEVQIFAGFTSQVYLTLSPTGSGTGSIYISVNWGVPINNSWTDYLQNPVLTKLNNFYDQNGISHPVVLYDNGNFKMWFNNMAGDGKHYTFYATSYDGKVWSRYNTNPILQPGISNSWDNGGTTATCVIKDNNNYKLYYTGYSDYTGRYNIGLATSTDGINWTKNPNPILSGSSSNWDYQVSSGDVVLVNGVYYLYYHASEYGSNSLKICLATSSDGINFTKYFNNPILVQTQSWEELGIARPSVIYDDAQFKMVYMNRSGSNMSLGMATSTDGKIWTKLAANPIFGCPMTSNGWASSYVAYPCFRKIGNEYRIYYAGSNVFDQRYGKIGFVSKIQ